MFNRQVLNYQRVSPKKEGLAQFTIYIGSINHQHIYDMGVLWHCFNHMIFQKLASAEAQKDSPAAAPPHPPPSCCLMHSAPAMSGHRGGVVARQAWYWCGRINYSNVIVMCSIVTVNYGTYGTL